MLFPDQLAALANVLWEYLNHYIDAGTFFALVHWILGWTS